MALTPDELQRFRAKTMPEGDCLVWTGPPDRDGYGMFYLRRKNRRAHRVAYFHAFGAIPKGCIVHHTCQNRRCVNIDHLRMVTVRENALRESDNVASLNARKTHCPRGHSYDRKYGRQRYCSTCERAKQQRLRAKWRATMSNEC